MISPEKVFVIIDEGSLYLFKDLCEIPKIKKYIIKTNYPKAISVFRKIHLNKKLSKYIWLPKRDMWFNKDKIINDIPMNGVLLVNSSAMVMPDISFWNDIRRKRLDVKFVLILVDSMHVVGGHMFETKRRLKKLKWDLILSYDSNDCKEFGFRYIGFNYYSKYCMPKRSIKNDLYYISSVKKGRERILSCLYKECRKREIRSLFQIYSMWRYISYGDTIRQPLKYTEVLKNISESNCILEIVQWGQKTQTLRYLEAVTYGKKLLTNNDGIVELPFYNPAQMKVFKKLEDIDWNWMMEPYERFCNNGIDISSAKILKYIF